MKKSIILLTFLTLLLVVSCGDIVDSDENIKKTAVTYAKVLENQETGVILPLKVGNKWLYTVDELNENEVVVRKRADSIEVIRELQLGDETWYEVYFPLISKKENVLMTNTEKGLWVRCEQCEDTSFLWAEYPYLNELFYAGEKHFVIKDNSGNPIDESYISIGKTAKSESITLSSGKDYETIKYEVFSLRRAMTAEHYLGDEYYVPDFGLVKAYNKSIFDIQGEIYELHELNTFDKNNCKNTPVYDLGTFFNRLDTLVLVEIHNTENESIILNKDDFILDNEGGILTLNIDDSLFPIEIQPNEKFSLRLSVKSVVMGDFKFYVYVKSQFGCWYKISIIGTTVI